VGRTAVNRNDVKRAWSTLRAVNISDGSEYGGATYNNDSWDVFSDVTEVRTTVNSGQWVRKNRWSGLSQKIGPNPFSYYYNWYSPSWGIQIEEVPSQGFVATRIGRIYDNATWIDPIPDAEKTAAIERAKMQLGGKFKNQRVNLAVAYGERKEAIRLFVDTSSRVVEGLRAVKKGDIQGAANAFGITVSKATKKRPRANRESEQQLDLSGRASSDWLSLQYGVKPLMQDVYGAAEAVAQAHVDGLLDVTRHVGTSTIKRLSNRTVEVNGVIGRTYCSDSYTAKFVVRAAVPRPVLQSVASLGFTNPASLIWELTTASFIVDWFINIGDYLNYLDSYSAYQFLDGSFTVFQKTMSGCVVDGSGSTVFGPTECHSRGKHTIVSCTREVLDTWPVLSLPRIKSPLSVQHALNSLALFRTTFFKRK